MALVGVPASNWMFFTSHLHLLQKASHALYLAPAVFPALRAPKTLSSWMDGIQMHEVILNPSYIHDVSSTPRPHQLHVFLPRCPITCFIGPGPLPWWVFVCVLVDFSAGYPPWWLKSQNLSEIPFCEPSAHLPSERICLYAFYRLRFSGWSCGHSVPSHLLTLL